MSAGKSDPEPVFTLIFITVFLFLAGWGVWHFFKAPILEGFRWLRYGELWALNLMFPQYDACMKWLLAAKFGDAAPTQQIVGLTNLCFTPQFLDKIPPAERLEYFQLSGTSIGTIGGEVGRYLHWPFAFAFAAIGYYTVFISPRNKFRTRHDLESFIRVQAKMWPVISPIVNFNPIKSSARIPGDMIPDKLPLFAEALSPEEWISFHRIPVVNNIPDREAARRAFLLQLGPRWNGLEGLPPYIEALYAAFALKGVQKREESDELLGHLAVCWSPKGGFKMPGALATKIRKLARDPAIGGEALIVAKLFAYRTTAMVEVLRWARSKGGVLAPAQFVWLRGVDRSLWYALNNLGRRSFHSEGAGAMAHYMAEQNAAKPLPIPRIDTAVVTLNQYLSDPARKAMPIPPREEATR